MDDDIKERHDLRTSEGKTNAANEQDRRDKERAIRREEQAKRDKERAEKQAKKDEKSNRLKSWFYEKIWIKVIKFAKVLCLVTVALSLLLALILVNTIIMT